jgi:hypothetical protein
MIVGKKQLKHLSTLGYSRGLADAARILYALERRLAGFVTFQIVPTR